MNITSERLDFRDRVLAADLFIPEEHGAGVLFVHGHNSKRARYVEYAEAVVQELGATCMTMDLGGHGGSEGAQAEMTISDHLSEVTQAYDFLAAQPTVDSDRIGVAGASYGGYLAARLTEHRPLQGLLLRAPSLYPDGMDDKPRSQFDTLSIGAFRRDPDALKTDKVGVLNRLAEFTGVVAVVSSEFDESIPETVIRAYTNAAPNSDLSTVKGAKHALEGEERQQFKAIVVDWAAKL